MSFKVGQRVKLSPVGIIEHWWPSSVMACPPEEIRGTVTKIARYTGTVYVQWAHYKTPQTYHPEHTFGIEGTA